MTAHVEQEWLKELSQTVDGIVASSPRSSDEVLTAVAHTVPLVILNREVPGISSVLMGTVAGSVQALEYLVSLGHERIAYVRGPETSWTDRMRLQALAEAAERLGVSLAPVGAFYPSLAAGAAAADAVEMTGATAVIFFNDILALGAMSRFRQRGIDVPGTISVIGCEDIFGAATTDPPLTTITAPGERAGRAATELLIGRFSTRSAKPRTDRIATHLTVRESTGPAGIRS